MEQQNKRYKSPPRALRADPLFQSGCFAAFFKENILSLFQKGYLAPFSNTGGSYLFQKRDYASFFKGGSRVAAADFRKHQRGISLLEIMLVMVISTMITAAAFMYYQSVQRNKEINNAIQLIQQIIAAVDNYRHPPDITVENGVAVSTTAPVDYYQGINPNLVANSGFIPQQYLQKDPSGVKGLIGITTPWFGDSYIDIQPGAEGAEGTYVITLYSIPNYACTTLERQLKTMRDSNAQCDSYQSEQVTCKGNILTMVNYSVGRMYCPTH